MKLVTAIDFGMQHSQFLNLLTQNNINPDSVRQIVARISNIDLTRVFFEIFLDYGEPGPSSKDVRIRLFYVKNSGTFVYDGASIR